MKVLLAIILIGFAITATPGVTPAQQMSDLQRAEVVLDEINAARVRSGLPPYASNPLLVVAAQRHSQYMRTVGQVVHDEPDAPSAVERVAATGYPFIRVNENIYAGRTGPTDAVEWWLTADELHRRMVLHTDMREVGIGAATNAEGTTYYTMVISAQPNVLPAFINNGADATPLPGVILTLTNETLFTSAAGRIGPVVQVQVSNLPDFSGAVVQPWAQYVNWTLDTSIGPGMKTVYIRYIDAAGQFADAQDTIFFDPRITLIPPTPTRTPPATRTATLPAPGFQSVTRTTTPTTPTAQTATLTVTPVPPTSTETASPVPLPTSTSTATETETPSPSATSILTVEATASPGITSMPVPSQPEPLSPQTLRIGLAVLLALGIIAIIAGIYFLMRGLHA